MSMSRDVLFTIRSGRRTPIAAIPTPDLAVPYDAPRHVNTMAAVQPIAPKKGYVRVSIVTVMFVRSDLESIGARKDNGHVGRGCASTEQD